jgi:hypothetical protein
MSPQSKRTSLPSCTSSRCHCVGWERGRNTLTLIYPWSERAKLVCFVLCVVVASGLLATNDT